jgi:hypothetical protein
MLLDDARQRDLDFAWLVHGLDKSAFGRFLLSVPDLTWNASIQLGGPVSLRRHPNQLSI